MSAKHNRSHRSSKSDDYQHRSESGEKRCRCNRPQSCCWSGSSDSSLSESSYTSRDQSDSSSSSRSRSPQRGERMCKSNCHRPHSHRRRRSSSSRSESSYTSRDQSGSSKSSRSRSRSNIRKIRRQSCHSKRSSRKSKGISNRRQSSHRRSHRSKKNKHRSKSPSRRRSHKPRRSHRSRSKERRRRREHQNKKHRRSSDRGCRERSTNRDRSACRSTSTANDFPQILPNLTDYAYQDAEHKANAFEMDDRLQDVNVSCLFNSIALYQNASTEGETEPLLTADDNEGNATIPGDKAWENSAENIVKMNCYVKLQRLPTVQVQVMAPIDRIKNIDPTQHSLSGRLQCQICQSYFNYVSSLVKHQVKAHPNHEVFPSRVAPDVAELLRGSQPVHQCEIIRSEARRRVSYKQWCYFCNKSNSFEKHQWIKHLTAHTGYFKYECTSCSVKFEIMSDHVQTSKCKVRNIWPFTEDTSVTGYLCDRCNYVRFDLADIATHLTREHGEDGSNGYSEVLFLRFPGFKAKAFQRDTSVAIKKIKNNNPDWHCLNTTFRCTLCRRRAPPISHYINVHPDSEVVPSRLRPDVAGFLRSLKYVQKCDTFLQKSRRYYKQFCYFCNKSKCLGRCAWIEHIASHTGYYRNQCGNCSLKFSKASDHKCKVNGRPSAVMLHRPQFDAMNIMAYLCDLCNFIRFDQMEMENHLRNEHEGADMNDYETIIFLSFPGYRQPLTLANYRKENPSDGRLCGEETKSLNEGDNPSLLTGDQRIAEASPTDANNPEPFAGNANHPTPMTDKTRIVEVLSTNTNNPKPMTDEQGIAEALSTNTSTKEFQKNH